MQEYCLRLLGLDVYQERQLKLNLMSEDVIWFCKQSGLKFRPMKVSGFQVSAGCCTLDAQLRLTVADKKELMMKLLEMKEAQ